MKKLFALSAIAMAAILTAVVSNASPLSGTYVVDGNQNCVNFLNGEAGVSFGLFDLKDTVLIKVSPTSFNIRDSRTSAKIGYAVGKFDVSGPVSDGTVYIVNQYQNNGTMFSTGYEGSNVSVFGQHVYAKVGKDVQIYQRNFNGNDLFCTLVGQ